MEVDDDEEDNEIDTSVEPSPSSPFTVRTPVASAINRCVLFPEAGRAPPGSPQPGTPGGGSLPLPTNPQAALALTLAPKDLKPVSVFPKFTSAGNFPSVCVIFSENTPCSTITKRKLSLQRRKSLDWRRARRRLKRGLFSGAVSRIRSFWRHGKRWGYGSRQRTAAENRFQRRQLNVLPVVNRLFGIRCRTRVLDRACALNSTCDAAGTTLRENPQRNRTLSSFLVKRSGSPQPQPQPLERQRRQGERFFTAAPPDCRTETRQECLA